MPKIAPPPPFTAGPLTRADAERLNEAMRWIFRYAGGLTATAPIFVDDRPEGVNLHIDGGLITSVCPMLLSCQMNPIVPGSDPIFATLASGSVAQIQMPSPFTTYTPYYWDTGSDAGDSSCLSMLVADPIIQKIRILYDGEYAIWLNWDVQEWTGSGYDINVDIWFGSSALGTIAGQTLAVKGTFPVGSLGQIAGNLSCYGSARLRAGDIVVGFVHNKGQGFVRLGGYGDSQGGMFGCRMIAPAPGGGNGFIAGPTGIQVQYAGGDCVENPNDCCDVACPESGSGSGSGSGGTDCFCGACGAGGGPTTLTATVTSASGCYTSAPATIAYSCCSDTLGGVTFHAYAPVSTVTCCGQSSGACNASGIGIWEIAGMGETCSSTIPFILMPMNTGGNFVVQAQPGWTCNPFSAVFLVDDGAGDTMTVTVTSP